MCVSGGQLSAQCSSKAWQSNPLTHTSSDCTLGYPLPYKQIIKINPRYATCLILSITTHPLPHPLPSLLRLAHIRTHDPTTATVADSYRPGDLVRASVLSLGDVRYYYLSTVGEDEGVVEGVSGSGGALKAVSWERMECSVTRVKEPRKVAKPRNLSTATSTTSTQPPP